MSGKAVSKGKPTARSQNFARQRKMNAPLPSSPKRTSLSESSKSSEWRLHGPNVPVKRFTGMVSRSENLSTNSVARGEYFATQIKDLFKGHDPSTKVYGIVFRYCLDFSNGTFGLIKEFDVNNPTEPNPLSRRKFIKMCASGVQILAPTDVTVADIPDDLWFVIKYDKSFDANVPVWVRTQYLQHSMPPKIEIPDSVLMAERDSIFVDAMDKIVYG
uniref:Coat protein n=1 Tax=Viola white distortion associated virus TaxID=694447 RepID=N0D6Q8_9BROM|nr:coat protein [Viola white distortion associated virus]